MTPTLHRHLQSLQTEGCLLLVREITAEHIPGEQIYDRHRVEKSVPER